MSNIMFKDSLVHSVGELPTVGTPAPDFELVGIDLAPIKLTDFRGRKVVLNIFPSIDTGVCALSVRTFNKNATDLESATVINVSKDLPFAQARFCGAEGIDHAITASAFRSSFGDDYGVTFADGPLAGLLSRSVVVIDEQGIVQYTQQVEVTSTEPDYAAALGAL